MFDSHLDASLRDVSQSGNNPYKTISSLTSCLNSRKDFQRRFLSCSLELSLNASDRLVVVIVWAGRFRYFHKCQIIKVADYENFFVDITPADTKPAFLLS